MTTTKEMGVSLFSKCRSLVCILSLFMLIESSAALANRCDQAGLAEFLVSAQSLATETEQSGQVLLKCPQQLYRQEAVFWLSFYYGMQKMPEKIAQLGPFARTEGADERTMTLNHAWQGNLEGLGTRVRMGQSSYADDTEVLITLSRNLARFGRYQEALEYSKIVISLTEDAEKIEIERLYITIWSGDQDSARDLIAVLSRFELSPDLRSALERAKGLVGVPLDASQSEVNRDKTWFKTYATDRVDRRGYRRRSVNAQYKEEFEVQVGAHQFGHPLEEKQSREAHLQFNYDWPISESLQLRTGLGYLTAGKRRVTGKIEGFGSVSEEVKWGLALRQEPLALEEISLVAADLGLMRQTLKGGLEIAQRLTLMGSLARDGRDAPFEIYQGEIKLGHLVAKSYGTDLGFYLPAELIRQPKPASMRESYPSDGRVGLGLRFSLDDQSRWRMLADLSLHAHYRSYYGNRSSYETLIGANAIIEVRYLVRSSWYVYGEAQRQYIEQGALQLEDRNQTKVLLGIALVGAYAQSSNRSIEKGGS